MAGSRPFIAAGTCKREDGDTHAKLIATVVEACEAESDTIGSPLFCIASDGESRRGLCLRPAPNCVFYLRKGKGAGSSCQVDDRKSRCPNLRRFAYASAATEALNAPCTNVPIVCPLCPSSGAAIWKYNAGIHFSKHHPTVIPTELLKNVTISKSEHAALQLRWEK